MINVCCANNPSPFTAIVPTNTFMTQTHTIASMAAAGFFPPAATRYEVVRALQDKLRAAQVEKVLTYRAFVQGRIREMLASLPRRNVTYLHFYGNACHGIDDSETDSPIQLDSRDVFNGKITLEFDRNYEETNEMQAQLIQDWITGELTDSLKESGYGVETAGIKTTITFDPTEPV